MELNAKQVEFNGLVAGAVGRLVEVTEKGTDTVHVFGIKGLDEKIGTMKDGTKVGYTVLERDDSGTLIVTSIHPNIMAKLLKNGSEAGMVLRAVEQQADTSVDVEEVVADKPAEVADELVEPVINTATTETAAVETTAPTSEAVTETAAPAEAPAAPSKKQQCVAIFKTMNGAGKPRKDVIAEFTSKVGLSAAGANTYYQNCKSGLWS